MVDHPDYLSLSPKKSDGIQQWGCFLVTALLMYAAMDSCVMLLRPEPHTCQEADRG